jgi:hypothetical protein
MNQWTMLKIATAVCLVISIFYGVSCKDTTGKESQQSVESVKDSERAIQDSNRHIQMTEQETSQAAEITSAGQRQQLSRRIVDRLEKSTEFPDVEKSITELSARLEQTPAGDTRALSEVTSQILAACQAFMLQQGKMDEQTAQANQKRLQQAEKKLKEAIQTAQQNQNKIAQVGPELMLGTLKLLSARGFIGPLQMQEVEELGQHLAISSSLSGVATEDAYAEGIQSTLPNKTIEVINARLEGTPEQTGEPASLKARLAQAEQKIQLLEQQQKTMTEQLEMNRNLAKSQQEQYLALLEQSDKAQGDAQYQLYEQAYRLRVGPEETGQPPEGIIYHESQAELLESQLAALQSRLDYYMLQRQQIRQTIQQVEQTVAELKNSPLIAQVRQEVEQSKARRSEWVGGLTRHVDNFEKSEQRYVEDRLPVVGGYDEARKAYLRASKAVSGAKDFRKTKDYADKMAVAAADELARFWLQDADHYAVCAELMGTIQGVPELQERVAVMQKNFQQQQQDALAAAKELKPEPEPGKEESPPKTPEPPASEEQSPASPEPQPAEQPPVVEPPPASSSLPAPTADKSVAMSPKMTEYLESNFSTIQMTPPAANFDILRTIASKKFSLTVTVDPDVKIAVGGTWTNMTYKAFYDDICQKNGLQWTVIGPDSIRISIRK